MDNTPNDFFDPDNVTYAEFTKGYIAGINRTINKLVELGKIDVTEAAELMVACISPDSGPVVYDWKLAKKTTP